MPLSTAMAIFAAQEDLAPSQTIPDEIASALEKLCRDPALRNKLGLNGRQRVEKRYQLQRMLEDYHRLYEEVSCDGGNRI